MAEILRHVYVVVCNGISDIGKGWLTASIVGLQPESTLPVKIDPLLNRSFPQHLGVEIQKLCAPEDVQTFIQNKSVVSGEFKISEDCETYAVAGAKIYPKSNIVAGDLLYRFLCTPDTEIRPGEVKKRTFNDVSHFLARELTDFVDRHRPETLIVEVGGTIEDNESIFIPGAMRLLARPDFLGIVPEIILLTYFDFAESYFEGRYRLKTQYIRRGITAVTRAYYQLPLKACFVRRRGVPTEVSDDVLCKDLANVAYETQLSLECIVLIPNVNQKTLKENLGELTSVLRQTGLFR